MIALIVIKVLCCIAVVVIIMLDTFYNLTVRAIDAKVVDHVEHQACKESVCKVKKRCRD